MTERERIAHHEAAHAVLALYFGMTLSCGIDLDGATSVAGASGTVGVNLFVADLNVPEAEQQIDLVRNLAVFCAGAASDAKLRGEQPDYALTKQPGDRKAAIAHALNHPLVSSMEEAEYVVSMALTKASQYLEKDEIWDWIARVAAACVLSSKMQQPAIEALR